MMSDLGYIHSIETFGSVDGPGIRYIVFLAGCPLRCQFCHNPDTWQITGKKQSALEVFNQAYRYKPYWKNEGGITVSGGEPLCQIDFLIELFTLAKSKGVHTVIDTAGSPFTRNEPFFSKFNKLLELTDLFLLDIKHADELEHIKLTGKSGENIKDMARYLSQKNKSVWIRHVLVPGVTDNDTYLLQLRDFIRTLNNVERLEVLPYHTFGIYKWENLGIKYPLEGVSSPTDERVKNAQTILECDKYTKWKQS